MKIRNEYGDKLADLDTACIAYLKGYEGHGPECFCCKEDDRTFVTDEWSGLIPEGFEYNYDRPTVTELQRWLREEHNIHVFIGWRPNVKKFDSHAYSLDLSPEEYMKKRDFKTFREDELFDSYEEALESGVYQGFEQLKSIKK
jgi:hypothetical protein